MSDQTNVALDTALQTAEAMAPTILSAGLTVAAATSPQAATIVALAPVALQLLQSAMKLQQAGAMSPDALASLFAEVGKGISDTHAQWAAMNEADAKTT